MSANERTEGTGPAVQTESERAEAIARAEEAAGLVGTITMIDMARNRVRAAKLLLDADDAEDPEGHDAAAVGLMMDPVLDYLERGIDSLVNRFTPKPGQPSADQATQQPETGPAVAKKIDYAPILQRDWMIKLVQAGRDRVEAARCVCASREHSPNDLNKTEQEYDEADVYHRVEVAVDLLDRGLEKLQAWHEAEIERERARGELVTAKTAEPADTVSAGSAEAETAIRGTQQPGELSRALGILDGCAELRERLTVSEAFDLVPDDMEAWTQLQRAIAFLEAGQAPEACIRALRLTEQGEQDLCEFVRDILSRTFTELFNEGCPLTGIAQGVATAIDARRQTASGADKTR